MTGFLERPLTCISPTRDMTAGTKATSVFQKTSRPQSHQADLFSVTKTMFPPACPTPDKSKITPSTVLIHGAEGQQEMQSLTRVGPLRSLWCFGPSILGPSPIRVAPFAPLGDLGCLRPPLLPLICVMNRLTSFRVISILKLFLSYAAQSGELVERSLAFWPTPVPEEELRAVVPTAGHIQLLELQVRRRQLSHTLQPLACSQRTGTTPVSSFTGWR